MLVLLPDPPATVPARLDWLPPLLGLAGVLACGLPGAWRAVLALACLSRLVRVWRAGGWWPRRLPQRDRYGAPALLHASASGPLTWRSARGAALAAVGEGSRVGAGSVRLVLGGSVLAVTARQRHPRQVRALARQLLRRQDPRWQPRLPQRGLRRALRRVLARFGYNRDLRVRRSPPCLRS